MAKKQKKKSLYKSSLLIFFLILLILSEAVLIYVTSSLKLYENGNADSYMKALVTDIKKACVNGRANDYFKYPSKTSEFEHTSYKSGYAKLFKENKITYVEDKEDVNKYDVFAGKIRVATVSLTSKKENRLGLLNFNKYKIKKIDAYNSNGIYSVDIYASDKYDIYVNDIKVTDDYLKEKVQIEGYSEIYEMVDLPYEKHFTITGLTTKPKITAKENENKIEVTSSGLEYNVTSYFMTDDKDKAFEKLANKDYDPLEFAKNWSLFLTADLGGPKYGLYKLTPNLIEGTSLYKRAYDWATKVDITFTSRHTLDKETFTNIKVSNYKIYSDIAFSVDISFEKNMTIANGIKRADKFNETLYFVYYEGAYRVVSMQNNGD